MFKYHPVTLLRKYWRRKMSQRLTRAITRDRETVIHAAQQIGITRETTPEGFLLCRDVPIAKVGEMLYGPGEVPIKVSPMTRVARVTRDAATLFAADTIASFNGKPVVNDHPDEDVTPRNWKKYSVGICLNPRRGTTEDTADVMLADLLITDQRAINDVLAGKREVSAGYDADYEQTGDGEGRQTSIIGNHVALVDRGRCGPRCAIGDHLPNNLKEQSTMGTPTKTTGSRARRQIPESVRQLFRDMADAAIEDDANSADLGGDTDGMDTGETGGGDNHTHIHIHTGAGGEATGPATDDGAMTMDDPAAGGQMSADERIDALEQQHAAILDAIEELRSLVTGGSPAADDGSDGDPNMLGGDPNMMDDAGEGLGNETDDMPPNTKDHAMRSKTGDSAALQTSFDQLLADAEVLVPGIQVPTFDAALPRARSVDRMCSFRRKVLGHMAATTDGAALLGNVAGADFDFEAADCAHTATVFKAAAGAKRLLNNRSATGDAGRLPVPANARPVGQVTSLAELNKRNSDYWAQQNAKLSGTKH